MESSLLNKKLRIKNDLAESKREFDERQPSRETCPEPSCKQFFGNSTLMMQSHRSRYPDHFKGKAETSTKDEAAVTEDLRGKVHRRQKETVESE
jgi:hypothetical protein